MPRIVRAQFIRLYDDEVDMARVVYRDENYQTFYVDVNDHQPEVTIGRNPGNMILIPAKSLSRYHAKIVYQNRHYFLIDLKSSNGTYVNNQRVSQIEIHPGDQIRFGEICVDFIDENRSGGMSGAGASPQVPPPSAPMPPRPNMPPANMPPANMPPSAPPSMPKPAVPKIQMFNPGLQSNAGPDLRSVNMRPISSGGTYRPTMPNQPAFDDDMAKMIVDQGAPLQQPSASLDASDAPMTFDPNSMGLRPPAPQRSAVQGGLPPISQFTSKSDQPKPFGAGPNKPSIPKPGAQPTMDPSVAPMGFNPNSMGMGPGNQPTMDPSVAPMGFNPNSMGMGPGNQPTMDPSVAPMGFNPNSMGMGPGNQPTMDPSVAPMGFNPNSMGMGPGNQPTMDPSVAPMGFNPNSMGMGPGNQPTMDPSVAPMGFNPNSMGMGPGAQNAGAPGGMIPPSLGAAPAAGPKSMNVSVISQVPVSPGVTAPSLGKNSISDSDDVSQNASFLAGNSAFSGTPGISNSPNITVPEELLTAGELNSPNGSFENTAIRAGFLDAGPEKGAESQNIESERLDMQPDVDDGVEKVDAEDANVDEDRINAEEQADVESPAEPEIQAESAAPAEEVKSEVSDNSVNASGVDVSEAKAEQPATNEAVDDSSSFGSRRPAFGTHDRSMPEHSLVGGRRAARPSSFNRAVMDGASSISGISQAVSQPSGAAMPRTGRAPAPGRTRMPAYLGNRNADNVEHSAASASDLNAVPASQDNRIASQDNRIASQDNRIASQDNRIASQDNRIASQDNRVASGERVSVSPEFVPAESVEPVQAEVDPMDAAQDVAEPAPVEAAESAAEIEMPSEDFAEDQAEEEVVMAQVNDDEIEVVDFLPDELPDDVDADGALPENDVEESGYQDIEDVEVEEVEESVEDEIAGVPAEVEDVEEIPEEEPVQVLEDEASVSNGNEPAAVDSAEVESLRRELREMQEKLEDSEQVVAMLNAAMAELKAQNAAECERLQSECAAMDDRRQAEVSELNAELTQVCAERDDLQAKCTELESAQHDADHCDAMKFVPKWSSRFDALIQYAKAMERAAAKIELDSAEPKAFEYIHSMTDMIRFCADDLKRLL